MNQISVLILMGSDSDLAVMQETVSILESFGISYSIHISSAHRTPARTVEIVREAEEAGVSVIIAAAGMAAHLAGVVAAETVLPVIGVPMQGGALNGVDALYSMVQMPAGIPVATMAVGKAGAKNAGLFAVQILSMADHGLKGKLASYKKKMAEEVYEKDRQLQDSINKGGRD